MRTRRILAAVLALTLSVAACSDDQQEADPNLPKGADLLREAAAATNDITSAHFTLKVNGTIPGLAVQSAEGDLTAKSGEGGAAKGQVRMTLLGRLIEGEFVLIDDKIHIKGPTGDFQELDASLVTGVYDPAAILDPDRGIAHVLTSVQDPKTVAVEDVDGVSAYKIVGRVSKDVIASLIPGIESDVDATVWVREDGDHQPLKATAVLPTEDNPSVDVTLSKLNEPVEITAPN
jgi:lipoprotein LprG